EQESRVRNSCRWFGSRRRQRSVQWRRRPGGVASRRPGDGAGEGVQRHNQVEADLTIGAAGLRDRRCDSSRKKLLVRSDCDVQEFFAGVISRDEWITKFWDMGTGDKHGAIGGCTAECALRD